MADLSPDRDRDFRGPELRLHYLAGAVLSVLLSVGAISFIHLALPYSSAAVVSWLSVLAGFLVMALGACLTIITDPRERDGGSGSDPWEPR